MKWYRKALLLCSVILAFPLVLLIRLLRPLVLIRFHPLVSERLGHFALNTEVYLCEFEAGFHGRGRIVDVFYHNYYEECSIANQQLKKMWDRSIRTWSFARPLDRVNRMIPGGENHIAPWREGTQHIDIHGLLDQTKAHVSFTSEEEEKGFALLEKIGIPRGAPWVCFHCRDSRYYETMLPDRKGPAQDHRNSDIRNMLAAVKELADRGYYVVRMGSVVKDALPLEHPKVIDYATRYRNDFLDIFLCAYCRFYLGDACGINALPMIFRKPVATINMISLGNIITWGKDSLNIPKKLWFRKEKRFLAFWEVTSSGLGHLEDGREYDRRGIDIIENTAEEIKDLAVEMDERLKGTWQAAEEDKQLQQRFWSVFKPVEPDQVRQSRIGAKFLRQNRSLLE